MLKLDLTRLSRQGAIDVAAEIPADDPLWEGSGLAFVEPLRVSLRAQETGGGEIVVRGKAEGKVSWECRRCLEPVRRALSESLTIVFVPEEEISPDEAGGDVRPIPARARDVDLGEAVREELVLALDPFVVCDPDCRGLCPLCGVNLNHQTCECVGGESDPRWDALRTLKSE